ncbi:MAG: Gfo/Idh/MocA family oxidoreductase [Promethearchaeota archaeon]|nr:MAG: Gfo/Idh/MocA family oxidoreductase [Candidatus Lokiarchaeota archaeon]
MLKVGFIGTGRIFDLNVLGYLNYDDIEIACLCNRTIEKAKQKIKQFNINESIPVYSDYKEMLDKEELDIVEILLPHNLHAEATIYAANKGIKGISIQKPMALSLEEADKMIEACNNSGSILSIFENFIFAPHIMKAKELIDQDYIGDLSSIRIKVAMGAKGGWDIPESANIWRKDPKQVGGSSSRGSPVLLDNGWHAFTLGWWFFEEEIEKVFAWTDRYHSIDAPAYVMWKCKENKEQEHVVPQYGNMEFSFMPEMNIPSNYYNTDEFIEIIGSRGIMKINQGTSIGNKMSDSEIFTPIVIIRDGEVETYTDFEKDWKYSFINATKYFINAVKNNKEPILSGDQARYILKFNLAAIKSAELGKDICLDDMN